MDRTEIFFRDYVKNHEKGKLSLVATHDCSDSTETIAAHLGINGFITTISTACSSSANAIILGARMIKTGRLDRVLAGGTDSLTRFTLNGFNTLLILDTEKCRPFDKNRKGLTLGEGAAYVVLESGEIIRAQNKKPLAEFTGWGNACDAFHQTASSPDGNGAMLAMSAALKLSALSPSDIGYINAHGTGTPNNDLSEGIAIQRLFSPAIPPVSSTKSYTGHTLGAAGSVEAVISVLSLLTKTIFPNLFFKEKMDELTFEPLKEVMEIPNLRHIMSNSFGFGGNNSSIVLSAC
jgi:3-oxoacyl-[acyl-carrier-protein] synthase-1